jgi:exodeoxyribonuclease VII large subunit
MAAGEKSPDSFASVFLGTKRGVKRPPRPAIQADLFAPIPVDELKVAATKPTLRSAPAEPSEPVLSPHPAEIGPVTDNLATIRRVFTVRQLVGEIRQQVEQSHLSVWVEGEISNCRPASSGHLYFTLKDGEAQLPVVLFRRQAQLLAARPKDGDAVEVRGKISVYESRGQLQLIAETLELRGAGALELAYKRLKVKLQAEGLFAEERKRSLPPFPKCIGVVTSEYGAVLRDIQHVIKRRHARLNLLIYPAAMQGSRCAAEVVAGIRWFNAHPGLVDVIILARGGGSIEDLAGFNEEALARAIVASGLPVVSAIGHETDLTIADFVADLRAPTPSAAAELVTAAQHQIEERVWSLEQRVHRAGRYVLMLARQRYMRLSATAVLTRIRDAVSRRDQHLDELHLRLESAAQRRLRVVQQRLAHLNERLQRRDPTLRLSLARRRWQVAVETMARLRETSIKQRRMQLDRAETRLMALSPLAVLSRGYALVYDESGVLLRSTAGIQEGQSIRARLAVGNITAKVEAIHE